MLGAGQGYGTVIYITISTGIGGGIFTQGRVLTGRDGNAGEVGHIIVDTQYLQPCSCQGFGHWEGYSSGRCMPAFFRRWAEFEQLSPPFSCNSTREILEAATRGEPEAVRFTKLLARINARALSTLIVAYDPDIIIMDGPVIRFHPELIINAAVQCIDQYLRPPDICISPLEGKAPLLGAAAAVFSLPSKKDNEIEEGRSQT